MATEVPGKAESKIRRRVETIRGSIKREVDLGRAAARDLVGLKPVQAVVELAAGTIDNAGDLIKEQAKITREWVS